MLDQLEALGASTIVPGHGSVMPAKQALGTARQYIVELLQVAQEALAEGAGEDYANQVSVPEGYGLYWYRDNVRLLLRRALKA